MLSTNPEFRHTWLLWATAFLLLWAIVFFARSSLRRRMLWASILTTPFGLTEPLFVPEYWNPPSLFNLAQRTGFDIESLIFCFAIGGLGAVGYSALAPVPVRRMDHHARSLPQHRWHLLALASPIFVFLVLYFIDWNPIYPGISALVVGALATLLFGRIFGATRYLAAAFFWRCMSFFCWDLSGFGRVTSKRCGISRT